MTAPLYTDYPYRFGADGLTARTNRADHVRDLLEQLLFTRPGERLTRPQLGVGLGDLLFGPLSEDVAATAQMLVELAIQQHLSREISEARVAVRIDGSALLIDIAYRIIATGEAGETILRAEGVA
ncbi:GPW/gp25 family protein [Sphingomonas sp. BT-65]|uniref:GPW/gp25 family protein n=1 Tax=Sphingomonas sp. BT-65 TaxID=2989821 RepID=UPI002235752B|nr:GPW/gp25 family protein [Sphingomonas sp. BT-65]MCW4460954.1 GPW/gp25 family protein [Sphingomonas sp. BT-65]